MFVLKWQVSPLSYVLRLIIMSFVCPVQLPVQSVPGVFQTRYATSWFLFFFFLDLFVVLVKTRLIRFVKKKKKILKKVYFRKCTNVKYPAATAVSDLLLELCSPLLFTNSIASTNLVCLTAFSTLLKTETIRWSENYFKLSVRKTQNV